MKKVKWYHILWYMFTHNRVTCNEFDNAIEKASVYGLHNEVRHSIIHDKLAPHQALKEWDL